MGLVLYKKESGCFMLGKCKRDIQNNYQILYYLIKNLSSKVYF